MAKNSEKAIGVDISLYQPVVDYGKLARDFDFAIIRCGGGESEIDKMFAQHVQGCYDAGIPALAYYWFDPIPYFRWGLNNLPTADKDPLLLHLKRLLKYKAILGLCIDHEQWWADWGKYYDYTSGKISRDQVPMISPAWMQQTVNLFLNHIQDDPELKGLPLINYSAKWFVDMYPGIDLARQLTNGYHLWTASYPSESYPATVKQLSGKAELLNYLPKDTTSPVLFGAATTWKFWQFSGDRLTLPYITDTLGRPSGMDLDLYNGTRAELFRWLGYETPENEPEPEAQPEPGGGTVDNAVLLDIQSKVTAIYNLLKPMMK